jgi:predicted ATPase/DNA-binding NarL/FixJ family response regulator
MAVDSPPTNLPLQLTSFIGRAREIAEVKRLLGTTRLLTLTGSGGAGKTRLALQVATDLSEHYADGAWFIDLAPLTDAALVPQTIASAFGVMEKPNRSLLDTLADFFRTKQILLVLDNCEHLRDAAAQIACDLMTACPNLAILATSRESLNTPGEFTWRVPSLSLPDSEQLEVPAVLIQSEAVRLFVERARAAQSAFSATSQNAATIVQICQRLDGMPLAIELAAARVRVLTAAQIAARLDNVFHLLTRGSPELLPRQQTLRATIDWSFDLLSEQERLLFRRLAVFAGGFTLQAAESVCFGDGIESNQILDRLSDLVDKSLVTVSKYDEGAEVRYRLLEMIRQYAREKLDEAGEGKAIRDRHLDCFLELGGEAGRQLRGCNQMEWLQKLDLERDNLRAAVEWGIETKQTEKMLWLTEWLGRFWRMRSDFNEGRRWFERIFALADTSQYSRACAGALVAHAILVWLQTAPTSTNAQPYLEQALAIARANGDKLNCAYALDFLGLIASMVEHDHATARAYLEESRMLFQEIGEQWGMAQAIWHLGFAALEREDNSNALELCEQALVLFRECGDQHPQSILLQIIGRLLYEKGERARGVALLRQALVLAQRIDSKYEIGNTLYSLSRRTEHDPARAVRLAMASSKIYESIGSIKEEGFEESNQHLRALRAQLGDMEFARVSEEGKAMTLEQAIEYALAEPVAVPPPIVAPPYDPNALTPREIEVLRWVAAGLSDAQVADKLVISPRTVNTHLSSIYGKLGINSRSAATRYALDRKLV